MEPKGSSLCSQKSVMIHYHEPVKFIPHRISPTFILIFLPVYVVRFPTTDLCNYILWRLVKAAFSLRNLMPCSGLENLFPDVRWSTSQSLPCGFIMSRYLRSRVFTHSFYMTFLSLIPSAVLPIIIFSRISIFILLFNCVFLTKGRKIHISKYNWWINCTK